MLLYFLFLWALKVRGKIIHSSSSSWKDFPLIGRIVIAIIKKINCLASFGACGRFNWIKFGSKLGSLGRTMNVSLQSGVQPQKSLILCSPQ